MANGIGRLRTVGIAIQPTFGTYSPTATFAIPLTNEPSFQPVVNKLKNQSALGSAYMNNEAENGNRMAEVGLEFKIDEDQLPLWLSQRYAITSNTASGETAVYEHGLAFQNTTQNYVTLYFQDDQRQDYIMPNVLLSEFNPSFDGEFVRASVSARGSMPTATSVSNTITQPKEFVGRMVSFKYNDDGSAVTASNALSIEMSMSFGLNGDDSMYFLGNQDLATNELTADEYSVAITGLQSDRSNYDDYINNTAKQFTIEAESTDRFVTGSVASTRPSILVNVPYAKVVEYSEDASLDDLIKETFTLEPFDKVGETDAPMSFTIVNSVASY